MRKPTLTLLALTVFAAASALAIEPVNKTTFGSLAIKGYDPVAYFTEGKPVEGTKQFTYEWMKATWRFANANNRELFAKDPEKYAPQYGGYCAYAVSEGYTADIDPKSWKIVNEKLYLNYNPAAQQLWEKDIPSRIAKADKNWPELKEGKKP